MLLFSCCNSSGQRQNDGRPPIPTRPGDDDDNKLDERDLGDEAPLVVVMDESKDLTAEEAAQAQQGRRATSLARHALTRN